MKLIKGDGKERSEELYEVLTKLPSPYKRFKLNHDQKHYYRLIGNELVATKKLAKVDLIHVHRLAVALYQFQLSVGEMNEHGAIQKFNSGALQLSPWHTLQEKANKVINDVSKHFGFSFKNRYDLKANKVTEDPNQTKIPLWEEFDTRAG